MSARSTFAGGDAGAAPIASAAAPSAAAGGAADTDPGPCRAPSPPADGPARRGAARAGERVVNLRLLIAVLVVVGLCSSVPEASAQTTQHDGRWGAVAQGW